MKETKVAIVYDFDKTLSTDDMQAFGFIQGLGLEVNDFWNMCGEFTKQHGVDSALTYMYMMVKCSKEKNIPFTKEYLKECGKLVKFFDGVLDWFDRINAYGNSLGITVEHYVISSGLEEIISGTAIADKFNKVFAGKFVFENGKPVWPALALNYTNKTQYLYRINKGCLDILDRKVNEEMPHELRPVPFTNMVYIGDSETDIPCMRLIYKYGGTAVGLYQPNSKNELYLKDLLSRGRISFVAKADYTEGSELDKVIKGVLDKVSTDTKLEAMRNSQKK